MGAPSDDLGVLLTPDTSNLEWSLQMSDPKARSRKKTVDEIQQAIAQVQAGQSKVSISAVAKLAGVTPALIHNTYPVPPKKSEGW